MTLYQLIEQLKAIALRQPNVRSASEGSVYEIMNANPGVDYDAFVITQGVHSSDDNFNHFNLSLFLISRLESDLEANRLQVQSSAREVLDNILTYFAYNFDGDTGETITFHTFTERFADECAGAWCEVTVDVPKSGICPEDYDGEDWVSPNLTIRNQTKTVEVTAATQTVTYDSGYTGLESVEIDATNYGDGKYEEGYSAGYEQGDSEGYNEGYAAGTDEALDTVLAGTVAVTYDSNGTWYADVDEEGRGLIAAVTVNVPQSGATMKNQTKSVSIVANGKTEVTYDSGYTGLEKVDIDVNVPEGGTPINNQSKTVNITTNGTSNIGYDSGYTGLENVEVNVDVPVDGNLSNLNAIKNGVYYPKEHPRQYFTFTGGSRFDDTLDYNFGFVCTFRMAKESSGYILHNNDIMALGGGSITVDGAAETVSFEFRGMSGTAAVSLDTWHTIQLCPNAGIFRLDGQDMPYDGTYSPGGTLWQWFFYNLAYTDVYEFNKWNSYSSDTAPYDRNFIVMKNEDGTPGFYDNVEEQWFYLEGDQPEYKEETVDGWNSVTVNVRGRLQEKYYTADDYYFDIYPDPEYDGMSMVSVDATDYTNAMMLQMLSEVQQGAVELNVTANGRYEAEIEPGGPWGYITAVTVNVPQSGGTVIKNQPKTVSITANGTTNVTYDGGYTGLEEVDINVNVPQTGVAINNQERTVSITANGSYYATYEEGYTGLEGIDINVNVPQTGGTGKVDVRACINSGLTFCGMTWTEIPEGFDLNTSTPLTGGRLDRLFYDCTKLESVPPISGNGATNMTALFFNCQSLPNVTMDFTGVEDVSQIFAACYNLTGVSLTGTDSIMTAVSMFAGCRSLEQLEISLNGASNINNMFLRCNQLGRVKLDIGYSDGDLDLSFLFDECTSLHTAELNTESLSIYTRNMFGGCASLENLSMKTLPDSDMSNIGLDECPLLTLESIVGLLEALPVTENGYKFQLGETNIAKLNEDGIAIATDKGWSLI